MNPHEHRRDRKPAAARISRLICVVLPVAACASMVGSLLVAQDEPSKKFSTLVDAKGNISLPKEFEANYVHLGTIAVATEAGQPVDQMHSTYTRSEDLEAFRQSGKFADGAVLVKAVRGATHQTLTTGETSFGKDIEVVFVMMKDSQGRFVDNDLWGDGWGWALFKGEDLTKQVATDYASDCRHCHTPAESTDWVFTQCYPVLQSPDRSKSSQIK